MDDSSKPQMHGAQAWLTFLHLNKSQLIGLFFCAFAIWFNPFSSKDNADKTEADLFNFLYSPFYGTPGQRIAGINTGQNAIVVVLFDDAYLRYKEIGWPIKPEIYSALLSNLEMLGSIGVYVDIRFQADKNRGTELKALYESANAQNIPVVFGGNLRAPKPAFENTPAKRVALLQMLGARHTYRLQQGFELRENGEYRHIESEDELKSLDTETKSERIDTAAYAMYRIWCDKYPSDGCRDFGKVKVGIDDEMFLQWGYAPDPAMAKHYRRTRQQCQQPGADWYQRVINSLFIIAARMFRNNLESGHQTPCLYHRNFSALLFDQLNSPELAEFKKSKEFTELKELVEGKIVLIGANVSESPDDTYSPVQLYVPGVFRHAMALDNLIERNDNYLRWVESLRMRIEESILLVVVFGISMCFRVRLMSVAPEKLRMQMSVLCGFSIMMLLFMASGINIGWRHLGPNNWISYLLIFVAVEHPGMEATLKLMRNFWLSRIAQGPEYGIPVKVGTWALALLSAVPVLAVLLLILIGYLLLALNGRQHSFIIWTMLLALITYAGFYFLFVKLINKRELICQEK